MGRFTDMAEDMYCQKCKAIIGDGHTCKDCDFCNLNKNKSKKICLRCGKRYFTRGSKYCSCKCYYNTQTRKCIVCGKTFKTRYSYVKEGRMKTCSRECGYKIVSKKLTGKNNGMWKENVGYTAVHDWIRRRKDKPTKCEICKKNKPYDLANISGNYLRNVNDFKWLCRRCHMFEDGRIKNLINYNSINIPANFNR